MDQIIQFGMALDPGHLEKMRDFFLNGRDELLHAGRLARGDHVMA